MCVAQVLLANHCNGLEGSQIAQLHTDHIILHRQPGLKLYMPTRRQKCFEYEVEANTIKMNNLSYPQPF